MYKTIKRNDRQDKKKKTSTTDLKKIFKKLLVFHNLGDATEN